MPDLTLEEPTSILSHITSPASLNTVIAEPVTGLLTLPSANALNSVISIQVINSTLVNGQGPSGPVGPAGSAEEMAANDKEVDFVGTDVIYKGDAAPGSSHSAAVWRIKKLTFVGEDFSERYANGTSLYDKVWSNRASYTY